MNDVLAERVKTRCDGRPDVDWEDLRNDLLEELAEEAAQSRLVPRRPDAEIVAVLQELRNQLRLRPTPSASNLETALREVVRGVVCEEARSALADDRAEEREREATKLLPLAEAARKLGVTAKALRSRIDRGTVVGARRVGGRWHLPISAVTDADR